MSTNRKSRVPELLKGLFELSAFLGVVAFISGWTSLYSYYESFGLGLFDLDIPTSVASVFAFRVLGRSPFFLSTLVVAIVLIISNKLWPLLHHRGRLVNAAYATALVLALLGSVIGSGTAGTQVGRALAREDMYERTSRLPLIAFEVSERFKYFVPDCIRLNLLECRLLSRGNGYFYVFEAILSSPPDGDARPATIELYSLAEGEVTLARIQRSVE